MKIRYAVAAGVTVTVSALVWAAIGPALQQERLPLEAALPDGYVGQKTCGACHGGIYDSFQRVGMARGLYRPARDNIIEDYQKDNAFHHKKSGFYYQMVEQDGRFHQRRYVLDSAGNPAHVHQEEVTYIVGSGNHARSYLRHHPNGVITQLPIAWYAQKKQWGMSPGYDREDHPDFTRAVQHGCIFCHGSYPRVDPENAADEEFFPFQLSEGIGCERCHGPGLRHVQLASKAALDPEVRKAIYNPARDSKEAQRAVCYQCHQETVIGGFTSRIVRPNQGPFSYRPGEPFSSYAIQLGLERPTETGQFHLVQHADLMELSRCFLASSGEMTCTTCHDPHRKITPQESARFYRERCIQCHETNALAKHSPTELEGDCTSCHMPRGEPMDAAHTVFTNHRIAIYKDLRADFTPNRPTPLSLVVKSKGAGLSELERTFFLASGYLGPPLFELVARPEQVRKGIQLLEDYVAKTRDPQADSLYRARAYALLGKGYQVLGLTRQAIDAYKTTLQISDRQLQPLYNLALVYASQGDLSHSKESFSELIASFPYFAPALHGLGALADASGQEHKAIEYFEKAIQLFPGALSSHLQLAQIYRRQQKWDRAIEEARTCLALSPKFIPAYLELGRLYLETAKLDDSVEIFKQASRIDPANTDVLLALAVVHLKKQKPAETKKFLEQLLRIQPDHPQGRRLLEDLKKIGTVPPK